jgi:hypothetical protein
MTKPRVHTEWADRPTFAPAAEALGISTAQVLAVFTPPNSSLRSVLFTPVEGSSEVWSAILAPDDDGILRERERVPVPNFMENLLEELGQ